MLKFMSGKEEKLAYRKKTRTYSKHLVITLSTTSLIGYIIALAFNITGTILNSTLICLKCIVIKRPFSKAGPYTDSHY